ncbi:hypothetical protein Dimus_012016 [Dionaea muscipula]
MKNPVQEEYHEEDEEGERREIKGRREGSDCETVTEMRETKPSSLANTNLLRLFIMGEEETTGSAAACVLGDVSEARLVNPSMELDWLQWSVTSCFLLLPFLIRNVFSAASVLLLKL